MLQLAGSIHTVVVVADEIASTSSSTYISYVANSSVFTPLYMELYH